MQEQGLRGMSDLELERRFNAQQTEIQNLAHSIDGLSKAVREAVRRIEQVEMERLRVEEARRQRQQSRDQWMDKLIILVAVTLIMRALGLEIDIPL